MGSSNAEARYWSWTRMLCFICHLPAASAFADKIEMQGYWEKANADGVVQVAMAVDSFSLVDANQRKRLFAEVIEIISM
jgi:hypothetical protein